MKKLDKSAIFLLALGVFIILEARTMGVGSFSRPGAGLFPLLSGVVLLTMALIILVASAAKKVNPSAGKGEGRNVWSVFYVLGALLFFRLTLPVLGYSCTAFIVLVFLIKIVGGHKWFPTVVWSVVFTGFSYLLFAQWLMVQFPKGVLPF